MKKQISILVFLFGIISVQAQGLFYPIDDSHSSVKFIGQLGDWMEVEGTFGKIWGYLHFDETDITKTSISFFIDPVFHLILFYHIKLNFIFLILNI